MYVLPGPKIPTYYKMNFWRESYNELVCCLPSDLNNSDESVIKVSFSLSPFINISPRFRSSLLSDCENNVWYQVKTRYNEHDIY